jgi:hypothetical protein
VGIYHSPTVNRFGTSKSRQDGETWLGVAGLGHGSALRVPTISCAGHHRTRP